MTVNHPCNRPGLRRLKQRIKPFGGATKGLTLIELLVVLVILVALGSIVTATISNGVSIRGADGVERGSAEIVTLATMQEVRDALIGVSSTEPGYYQDLGNLPSRLGGLIQNIDSEDPFDPARKRGWRGPYLYDAGTQYGTFIEAGDNFPTDATAGFNGIEDDPGILDAWGKPLLLIVEVLNPGTANEVDYSRLISAGPPASQQDEFPVLNSPLSMPTPASNFDRGNDLVLFLFTSDPNPQ